MDYKNRSAQKPVSVLQGDGFFFDRILSRETSVGHSSHVYYRTADGVPFNWEMQPGTPKIPPENEVIPPVTPPPAVQSLGLPRPCVDQTRASTWSRFWFWQKIRKSQQSKELQKKTESNITNDISTDKIERFEFEDSDKEFITSPHNSASSSSSSLYSSNGPPLPPSRFQRDLLDGPLCCSPWNMTAILNEASTNIYYRSAQNGFYYNSSPSRESSVSKSSRMYYRSAEGIPFKWEMQPGTPNNPPEEEVIPPPSPPPAVQSLGLLASRPCVHVDPSPKDSSLSKVSWFWKKGKKYEHSEKIQKPRLDEFENLEFYHSDCEINAASFRQSGSSSSSSCHYLKSSRDSLDKSIRCSAWNLTAILVCVPRRV